MKISVLGACSGEVGLEGCVVMLGGESSGWYGMKASKEVACWGGSGLTNIGAAGELAGSGISIAC